MNVSTTDPATAAGHAPASCPGCGAPADVGQLACLHCGRRLAVDYRRPPRWRLAAALAALALLLGVAGAGFALGLVVDSDERKAAEPVARSATPATRPARPAPAPREEPVPGAERARQPDKPEKKPAEPAAPPAGASGIRTWPRGKDAYTVVLQSLGDRKSAVTRAKEVSKDGIPAGVLDSDKYSSLSPNFWIVFAGVYKSQAQAGKAAQRYSSRGFAGAFPQFVNGSDSR